MPRICLSMIVKDEAHIIQETLECVLSYNIDCWVICDTGSQDNTPQLIQDFFDRADVPGKLHHRPWKHFGHNRSEALILAEMYRHPQHGWSPDYAWIIDADDVVRGRFTWPHPMDKGAYELRYRSGDEETSEYWRKNVVRLDLRPRYIGEMHEYLEPCTLPVDQHPPNALVHVRLQGEYHVESRRLGARSQDPDKYKRDAEVLASTVVREPDNARARFYLLPWVLCPWIRGFFPGKKRDI